VLQHLFSTSNARHWHDSPLLDVWIVLELLFSTIIPDNTDCCMIFNTLVPWDRYIRLGSNTLVPWDVIHRSYKPCYHSTFTPVYILYTHNSDPLDINAQNASGSAGENEAKLFSFVPATTASGASHPVTYGSREWVKPTNSLCLTDLTYAT